MILFYGLLCIVGTIVPWLFFVDFFSTNGFAVDLFVSSLFVNSVAGGFTADILLSILVFGVWSYGDAQREHVRNWWLVIPATLCVGLSLSLPLYLLLREFAFAARIANQEGQNT